MESFHHNSKSRSGYSTGYLKTPAETSNSSFSPYERYIRTRTLMRAYRRKRQELQVYYRGIATAKMADGNISYIVFDTIKRYHTPSQRQELAKYLFNIYENSREGHCRILRERRCTPPMAIFFVQPFATATTFEAKKSTAIERRRIGLCLRYYYVSNYTPLQILQKSRAFLP